MNISYEIMKKEDLQKYLDDGYTITDEYTDVVPKYSFYQLVKKISDLVYSVIDYTLDNHTYKQSEMTVNLETYTPEQLDEYAKPYYGSFEKAVEECQEDIFQIMAECIVETEFAK